MMWENIQKGMGFENERQSLNLVSYVFVLNKGEKELTTIMVTLHDSGHCGIQNEVMTKEEWSSAARVHRKMPLIYENGRGRLKRRLTKNVFEGEYRNK